MSSVREGGHKDRYIRFGFEWFERFFKSNGVELIVVNNECTIYGLRKYKKTIVGDACGVLYQTRVVIAILQKWTQ